MSLLSNADPMIGKLIAGTYEVVKVLGSGGMGRVYQAHHRRLNRPVAIKILHEGLNSTAYGANFSQRFFSEAQVTSRLRHPNIVAIHDFGYAPPEEGGYLFLVMELLEGQSLGKLQAKEKPLPFTRILSIIGDVLEALTEAHEHGVVHRDIKPENIFLEQRRGTEHARLIDFGIARDLRGQRLTADTSTLFGTPDYMAPEVLHGADASVASDLFSVGVVLYELLTCKLPFAASTPAGVVLEQQKHPNPDPRDAAPERNIPPALALLCQRALAQEPSKRFANAEAFATALRDSAVLKAQAAPPTVRHRVSIPNPKPAEPPAERKPVPRVAPVAVPEAPAVAANPNGTGFAGRSFEFKWAMQVLEQQTDARATLWWGPVGVGRTRLLAEFAQVAQRSGAQTISLRPHPLPWNEVSHTSLRFVVSALAQTPAQLTDAALLQLLNSITDASVQAGLQLLHRGTLPPSSTPELARKNALATLQWALQRALQRAQGRPLAVLLDDVDHWDRASQIVLVRLLKNELPPKCTFFLTSTAIPERASAERIRPRWIKGLTNAELLEAYGSSWSDYAARSGDELVEPLVAQLALRAKRAGVRIPTLTLSAIADAYLNMLPRDSFTALVELALCPAEDENDFFQRGTDSAHAPETLHVLRMASVLDASGPMLRIAPLALARNALRTALRERVAALCTASVQRLRKQPQNVELAAWYGLRTQPDGRTYMSVGQAATLRARLGDELGALSLLREGVALARKQAHAGEQHIAPNAWAELSRQLGEQLCALGAYEDAELVLKDLLASPSVIGLFRARVLEQLSVTAHGLWREWERDRYRSEALALAKSNGDPALIQRLSEPLPPPTAQTPALALFAANVPPPLIPGPTETD